MKRIVAILLGAVLSCAAVATENVQFLSKPLSAGKAMLTEDGFLVPHLLGTANFSPELRFPIQLIYRSTSEKTGLFGFGWSSPQLEHKNNTKVNITFADGHVGSIVSCVPGVVGSEFIYRKILKDTAVHW